MIGKKEKFGKKLEQHKKLIASMVLNKDKLLKIPVSKTGKELALAFSECKCNKCNEKMNLQYHHLIQKKNKNIMDYWIYISQRNYWANIVILCRECHKEIEGRSDDLNKSGTISKKMIKKVKKLYKIEGEE